jgi:hypothetical protein
MTSIIAALAIVLSSLGVPGFEHYARDVTDPVPCSATVDVPEEGTDIPTGPMAGPDTRKISNGF